jgi:hypothetical protein
MRKRVLLVTVPGLALLGLAGGLLFWINLNRPGVTQANYERIQKGMPLAEVEALLGRPGQRMTFRHSGAGASWYEGDVVAAVVVDVYWFSENWRVAFRALASDLGLRGSPVTL